MIEKFTTLPETAMPLAMPRSLEGHYQADSDLKGDTSPLSRNRCINSPKLISLSAC